MADRELDQFIHTMLDAKQLPGITNEVRAQLVADLKQRLLDQVNRALIDALPEDKIELFDHFLDDPDISDAQIQQFIIEAGVDVKQITTATMLRFYDLYVKPMERQEA